VPRKHASRQNAETVTDERGFVPGLSPLDPQVGSYPQTRRRPRSSRGVFMRSDLIVDT